MDAFLGANYPFLHIICLNSQLLTAQCTLGGCRKMSENMWGGNVGRKKLSLPNTDLKRRCLPQRASKLEWLSKTRTALRGYCKNVILIWQKERQGLHWVGSLHFVGRTGWNSCFSWKASRSVVSVPLIWVQERGILKRRQRAFGLGAKYWHCHFIAFMSEMWFLPFYHS